MLYHITGDLFPEFLHKLGTFRSWTHQTHIPNQDIKQLRQLIQAGPPQESTHTGNTRIPFYGPTLFFITRLLYTHSTEFVHHKGLIMKPHSFLFKNNRPFAGSLYHNCHQQQDRRYQNQAEKGSHKIHTSLGQRAERIGKRYIAYIDYGQPHQILHIRPSGYQAVVIRYKLGMNT